MAADTKSDFEFGFHYSGPIDATPDMDCTTCRSQSTKKCPTHGQQYAQGCAHCASAQGAPCQGHWGMAAALDEYGTRLTAGSDSAVDFGLAKTIVLGEPPTPGKTSVTINIRSDRGGATKGARSLHLELVPRP